MTNPAFVKGDRVQIKREYLDHPLRRSNRSGYTPGLGETGIVQRTPRKYYDNGETCDLLIVWAGDPKQRKTAWGDFWIDKEKEQS